MQNIKKKHTQKKCRYQYIVICLYLFDDNIICIVFRLCVCVFKINYIYIWFQYDWSMLITALGLWVLVVGFCFVYILFIFVYNIYIWFFSIKKTEMLFLFISALFKHIIDILSIILPVQHFKVSCIIQIT